MIFRRTLRDDWWKVLAYAGILGLNLVATILAYPTFETNFTLIMTLIPDFLGFLKSAMESVGRDKLGVFLALNHFFKGANIIGPAAAIVLALGSVVREVEAGTIGILVSRPVSRFRILLSFATAHLLELIVPLIAITLLLPLAASLLIEKDVVLDPFLIACLHGCAFISMVYAMSLFFAVLFSDQVKVAVAAGGICVLSFMLYFIEALKPYTLYGLSSMEIYFDIVSGKPYPFTALFVMLGIMVACFTGAVVCFRKKDY